MAAGVAITRMDGTRLNFGGRRRGRAACMIGQIRPSMTAPSRCSPNG